MKINDQIRIKYIKGELKGKDLKDFQFILSKNPKEKERIENLKTTHLAIGELYGKYIKEIIPNDSEENFKKILKGKTDSDINNKKDNSNKFLIFFTNLKQNFNKAALPGLVTAGIVGAMISPTYQIATRGGSSDTISVALSTQEDKIQTRGSISRDSYEGDIKIALSKILEKDVINENLEDIEEKINVVQQSLDNNSNSNIVIDDITIGITVKSSFVSKNGNNCRLLELNNNKKKKKLSFIACREVLDWNYYYYFK